MIIIRECVVLHLSVYVSADGDGEGDRLHVGLLHKDLPRLLRKEREKHECQQVSNLNCTKEERNQRARSTGIHAHAIRTPVSNWVTHYVRIHRQGITVDVTLILTRFIQLFACFVPPEQSAPLTLKSRGKGDWEAIVVTFKEKETRVDFPLRNEAEKRHRRQQTA